MPERGHSMRLAAAIASVLAFQTLCAGSSFAVDLAYEATISAGHSDNILRTSADEQDEDIAAAGLRFSLDQVSSRIEASAAADLAYNEYLDDTFDSELFGNFAAEGRFQLIPERFEWVVADNFGQVLSDPFAPATPDNREDINYFATGPALALALGSQMQLRLGARYSLVDYETSPFDSEGQTIEAGLVRLLSAASSISLNARTQEIEYDDQILDLNGEPLSSDYEQREGFLRYEVSGARTNLGFDVGYMESESASAAADGQDGFLLRLDASRRLSSSSTATLSLGRETSNSAMAFASTQTAGSIDLDAVRGRQTSAPFTNEYVSLGWNFARNRTYLGLFASWSDQQYQDVVSGLDQTLSGFGAYYTRQLSSRMTLGVTLDYQRNEFEEGQDYEDIGGQLNLNWRMSRSLSLDVRYDRYDRSSDIDGGDSTENRYWLSLTYAYGTPRRQYAPPSFRIDKST
jgi:hypothetical protein